MPEDRFCHDMSRRPEDRFCHDLSRMPEDRFCHDSCDHVFYCIY